MVRQQLERAMMGALFVLFTVLSVACGGQGVDAHAPAASCPPPGTEEPIGKVLSPAFSDGYRGCHVRTRALFWSPNTPASYTNDPNVVVFQVTPPGTGQGQGTYYPVKITKAQSGPIFELKQGDPIVLTGGTEGQPPMFVFFVADGIERDTGK